MDITSPPPPTTHPKSAVSSAWAASLPAKPAQVFPSRAMLNFLILAFFRYVITTTVADFHYIAVIWINNCSGTEPHYSLKSIGPYNISGIIPTNHAPKQFDSGTFCSTIRLPIVHPCRDPEHRVAQQASAGVFCGKAAGLRPVKAYPACRPRACRSGDFQGRGQTAH